MSGRRNRRAAVLVVLTLLAWAPGAAGQTWRDLQYEGSALVAAGRFDQAEPLVQDSLAQCEAEFGPDHPLVARVLDLLADICEAQGRLQEAERIRRRVLAIAEQIEQLDAAQVTDARNSLGNLLLMTSRAEEAGRLFGEVIAVLERVDAPPVTELAKARLNKAKALIAQGDCGDAAEELVRRAASTLAEACPPGDPELALGPGHLGLLARCRGDLEAADRHFARAQACLETVPDHAATELPRLLQMRGEIRVAQKRPAEAAPLLERALALYAKRHGVRHAAMAPLAVQLAGVHAALGDRNRAETALRRAVEVCLACFGPDREETATCRWKLARNLYEQGDMAEALPFFLQARDGLVAAGVADVMSLATTEYDLARTRDYLEEDDTAERGYRRALDLVATATPADAAERMVIAAVLAGVLVDRAGYEEAQQVLARSAAARPAADDDAANVHRYEQARLDARLGRVETAAAGYAAVVAACDRGGPDSARLGAYARIGLADIERRRGLVASACAQYARADSLLRIQGWEKDRARGEILGSLAAIRTAQGRIDAADSLYGLAQRLVARTLGEDHVVMAATAEGFAALRRVEGRRAEADSLARTALRLREAARGGRHPDVARSLAILGDVLRDEGRHAAADSCYARARAILRDAFAEGHPDLARLQIDLADLRVRQGRTAEAEDLYRTATAALEGAYGPACPDVLRGLDALVELCRATGRDAEAATLEGRARAARAAAR